MTKKILTAAKKTSPAKSASPKKDEKNAYRQKWIKKMEFLRSVSADNAVLFLHDTATDRFIYMSDPAKVLGNYNPDDFIAERRMDFFFSNVHPNQRSVALLIQAKMLHYGIENPAVNNTVANMLYTYKKKGGNYIQILQQSIVVETDAAGNPLLYLQYRYDISHLVKSCVGLLINADDETLRWHYNVNKQCLEQVNLLSAQEKKILASLAEGRSSKEIAELLFISSHTIDTHRRNLLKKTNCIDTTALVSFAKMTGMI